MCLRIRYCFSFLPLILAFCAAGNVFSQTTLFSENFNGCALPQGWQVNITGNQNAVWYVGLSQNSASQGQSIDGSCFLFIDDQATGNNTPGYVIDFVSPAFDASQFSTVLLTMDVHYRDWENGDEFMQILVTDGTTEIPLSRFDRYRKNLAILSDHFAFRSDLALVTQSPTARLIIRYNDGNGDWNWWAGVDNIKVTGSGNGTNIVKETFNACAIPAGWSADIVAGSQNWRFGQIQTGSNALQGGSSMDGSCFAYFDDDAIGNVSPSKVRLSTPWFDGAQFGKFELNYDVILRHYKETMSLIVEHGSGEEYIVETSTGDIGGPYFPDYVHETVDISSYRNQQMRVVFEYDDGNDWGWWSGIDNVKITGSGQALDLCANAAALSTGAACLPGDNLSAIFEGPPAGCADSSVAGVWYKWQADFTGVAKLGTHATFNDVVDVFTGGCASPQPVVCNNRDEHGFTGETTYFQAQSGTQYLFRVSGNEGGFGVPRGELCIEIAQAPSPTPPVNDDCANAIALTANGSCMVGSNINASMSATLPSLNERARADVWYTFTAGTLGAGEKLLIQSNASFSDIITLYQGGCGALAEVASNQFGGALELPPLNNGQPYWVQIAGNFATVEGSLCPQLVKKPTLAPSNDLCATALTASIGGSCTAANNQDAAFSGYKPTCVAGLDNDIWFKFTAPPSGSVHLNSGAEFEHVMAIWEGDCSDLSEVYCAKNPLRCNGYVTVIGLNAGQTYYVQIASWEGAAGTHIGDVCLKILDGQTPPDFQPMSMEVTADCTGDNNAELDVSVSGGFPPYSFEGNTDGQILNSGETYVVIASDALGCMLTIADTVGDCGTAGCILTAAVNAVNPKCFGSADGTLSANVSDGTAPFSYMWSNNDTIANIGGLPAGTYSLTVTDAQGCETTLSKTLTNPPLLQLGPSFESPSCWGDLNGFASAGAVGGTPPLQYLWSNDATSASINGIGAGDYSVVVTDAHGCTVTTNITLTEPDTLLIAQVTATDPKCPAESNGTLGATPDGGTSPYFYQWSSGGTTASIDGLPAGDYTLTVTDENGCTATVGETLTDPPAIGIVAAGILQPEQGQSNGAIGVDISGGTGSLTLTWYRNNTLLISGVEDLDNIPAGNYMLIAVDENGCEATFTYNLTETVGTYTPGQSFFAEVYPNPTQSDAVLAVAFESPQSLQLILRDATGRMLQNRTVDQVTEQKIPLRLADLPGGVYQLQVLAGRRVATKSIVVIR
ncbi:MAG: T9SS type A sorting domain-containing protein [Lewinellaceae bacterium]|nr:T9SS type A sorting domain-containing protein [Lewinellaceae bacterium]